jgi:hypothetical protein
MVEIQEMCLVIILLVIFYFLFCNKKTPAEKFEIRDQNKPRTYWKPTIYSDDAASKQSIGSIQVTLYHKYKCTEFSPLASLFRKLKEHMQSSQILFLEEVVEESTDPKVADYGNYPMIIKKFPHGISNKLQVARYTGSTDFGELQDWILSDAIETLTPVGLPCGDCNKNPNDPYPTTSLDPSGKTHSYM